MSGVAAFLDQAKKYGAQLATKAKAFANNLSDIEIKTLEATNEEHWGPHGSAMAGIDIDGDCNRLLKDRRCWCFCRTS